MAEQPNNNTSDEIDLGQLFQMIGRGFNKLGISFLRLFVYLKRKAFILGGLLILGLGLGYGLNQITEEKKKIEVIVKPNLESENYLYDVVTEIENNIKVGDTTFFREIEISNANIANLGVKVEPVEVEKNRKGDLELFEKFKDNPGFSDIIKSELLKNTALNHRVIFTFKNNVEGLEFSEKVMDYINSNDFYRGLIATSIENAKTRIEQNELLIEQINILVKNYSESIKENQKQSLDTRISLDNEKPMDITGLFQLKNALIQEIERKKIELLNENEPVKILNFGKPQKVTKSFFGKKLVLIPVIFLGVFFAFEFILFLNRKARTYVSQ